MSDSWSDSEPDDDEATSPNVELLFQQAFAEADPAPSLLKVVKEHPTYENIDSPLIECYVEAVEKNPSRGPVLASALAKLDTLSADIDYQLDWAVHFKILFDGEAYGPTNKFLFHSLLSGLSLKNQLTRNSSMHAAIEGGLDSSANNSFIHSVDPEVLVVGACIQLLLCGSAIERAGPRYGRSAEVVAKNLKDRKASGVVKDPHAIQVLEVSKLFRD
jgi:hypothetical protein